MSFTDLLFLFTVNVKQLFEAEYELFVLYLVGVNINAVYV